MSSKTVHIARLNERVTAMVTADGKGSHGCDDPSDMNIPHFYSFIGE